MPPTDPPTPAFASADERTMFDWVWHEVAAGDSRPASGKLRQFLLLVGTLAVFVWAADGGADPVSLAVLVGAVLVHELGHYLGMRAFGYRDVKMFFIPFIGAAVAGNKHAAPAWQRGVVSLLGPLPGILLGAAAYAVTRQPFYEGVGIAILIVIGLNVLNLIPIEPLDGGRLMTTVIFSRSPQAEGLFGLAAVVALGLTGWLVDSWAVIGIAGLVLFATHTRFVQSSRAAELRQVCPHFSTRLDALNVRERLTLFRAAVALLGGASGTWPNPKQTARMVRNLHEAIVVRPPGLAASAALLSAYALGFAVAVGVWFCWQHDRNAIREQARDDYERGQLLIRDPAPARRRDGILLMEAAARTSRRLAAGVPTQTAARDLPSIGDGFPP